MKKIIQVIAFLAFLSFSCGDRPSDLVDYKNLPDLPHDWNPKFRMWSGYLDVSESKKYHYVFVESEDDPKGDPVVLWMNGGPGCSSMVGLFHEHGPLYFRQGSQVLEKNQWSWNRVANMLYLESPQGVGFSYTTKPEELVTNDEITAEDHLKAVHDFFRHFPEFRFNPFYVAGEEYAGIYGPLLALQIDKLNELAPPEQTINLVGLFLGNANTEWNIDGEMCVLDVLYERGFYGSDMKAKVDKYCKPNPLSIECFQIMSKVGALYEGVNPYNLIEPCHAPITEAGSNTTGFKGWRKKRMEYFSKKAGIEMPQAMNNVLRDTFDCIDISGVYNYLQKDQVRNALHIPNDPHIPKKWEPCNTGSLDYWTDYEKGSYYYYPLLLSKGYTVLVYSGDLDAIVSTHGTLAWIRKYQREYNLRAKSRYDAWFTSGVYPNEAQEGGYIQLYAKKFTFASILGAGHMTAVGRPSAMFQLFEGYTSGEATEDEMTHIPRRQRGKIPSDN